METETIRELIAAFQELGGEAKEAFVWYLVVAYLPAYAIGLFWSVIGAIALLKGVTLLVGLIVSERLKQAAGIRFSWHEHEIRWACDVLRASKGTRVDK